MITFGSLSEACRSALASLRRRQNRSVEVSGFPWAAQLCSLAAWGFNVTSSVHGSFVSAGAQDLLSHSEAGLFGL